MSDADFGPFDVEPHLGVLRRYALVLTRSSDEAEDLVQEALLRAIAGAASWQPARGLRPWLLSIVHNTHVSRQRRRQVEQAARGELAQAEPAVSPAIQLQRVELAQTMAALMRLPEDQREVLVLVAIEGLAYKDAAEILDLPLGTLMSRLARAREALRRAVGQGDGPGQERPSLRVVR
ncbi:MAG: sigma-70 family RNA polymerase sigma factor [Geminicoccaceae bacterium]